MEQPAAPAAPAAEPVVTQEPAPAPAPERMATAPVVAERDELPATASFLPLLGLIGLGALVGNRLMQRSRRSQA